jgi:hypothetical protein
MSVKIGYRLDVIAYLHTADNAAIDSHMLGSRYSGVSKICDTQGGTAHLLIYWLGRVVA